jgi:Recombination endonuclease VII
MADTILLYNGPIVTTSEARKTGQKRYFTGKPCIYGHIAQRHLSGKCIECIRLKSIINRKSGKGTRTEAARLKRKLSGYKKEKEYIKTRREEKYLKEAGRPRPEICDVCQRKCRIVFDHCHKTGKFRGWLCNPCNQSLGLLTDSPEILRKLANYLENFNDKINNETENQYTNEGVCGSRSLISNQRSEPCQSSTFNG